MAKLCATKNLAPGRKTTTKKPREPRRGAGGHTERRRHTFRHRWRVLACVRARPQTNATVALLVIKWLALIYKQIDSTSTLINK